MTISAESASPGIETPLECGECRRFDSDSTVSTAGSAYAELLARGLRLSITADGGLSVRPSRLLDGAASDLIRTHRDELVSIVAQGEPDPIRRGLLTAELAGWHIDADGNEVAGLQPWHAETLGVQP